MQHDLTYAKAPQYGRYNARTFVSSVNTQANAEITSRGHNEFDWVGGEKPPVIISGGKSLQT